MKLDEALTKLQLLELPADDYAVFGSGPLLVRGVIDEVDDLDILARGRAWETAATTGEPVYLPEHDITIASFFDGLVTIGTSWAIGDIDSNELIDTAESINGIRFVLLQHVVAYKKLANRPKDIDHLSRLELWQNSQADPDV